VSLGNRYPITPAVVSLVFCKLTKKREVVMQHKTQHANIKERKHDQEKKESGT
jgi:hypothetical protein